MLTRDTMRGLYALPPTPFDEEGTFLESVYRENLKTLMRFKVDAIVSPGSNGEWWSIDEETRRRLMEALYEECHGKVVAAACTSSTYTEESITRTRWAEEIGLDAVMNVPPFYFPLTREELRRYWHDLAEACPEIGLIVYNFPMVAQRLEEDLMQQLAEELPTLCGSKEIHTDFNVWLKLHRTTDLAVMSAHERLWFTAYFKAGGERHLLHGSCGRAWSDLRAARRLSRWKMGASRCAGRRAVGVCESDRKPRLSRTIQRDRPEQGGGECRGLAAGRPVSPAARLGARRIGPAPASRPGTGLRQVARAGPQPRGAGFTIARKQIEREEGKSQKESSPQRRRDRRAEKLKEFFRLCVLL
jgi:hypothetical protein